MNVNSKFNVQSSLAPSWFAASLAIMLLAGCNGNPLNRQGVEGTVTLEGKPLAYGTIAFISQNEANYSTTDTIENGKFEIPQRQGLPPGKYLVQISATINDPSLPAPPPGERDNRPGVEIIPPEFNAKSQHIVEIGNAPIKNLNFEIMTKGGR